MATLPCAAHYVGGEAAPLMDRKAGPMDRKARRVAVRTRVGGTQRTGEDDEILPQAEFFGAD
ncbi:hypothetical protein E2562_007904 [Oryza meyeriana var. granulata]|uniref:Uncharacterized protein n=1 Tax=Oryza meyeriana var. granulata TaxID=110450 RepID=A0A6G1DVS0_9ORYZ|nr:hypothetical protein E2562_007904 [Oryza meyeriana var. granulata]